MGERLSNLSRNQGESHHDAPIPSVSILEPYEGNEILPLYKTTVTVTGGAAGHGRASGHVPGIPEGKAKELVEETEAICPYSKMVYLGIASTTRLR